MELIGSSTLLAIGSLQRNTHRNFSLSPPAKEEAQPVVQEAPAAEALAQLDRRAADEPGVPHVEHTRDIGADADFHSSDIASLVARVDDLTRTIQAEIQHEA